MRCWKSLCRAPLAPAPALSPPQVGGWQLAIDWRLMVGGWLAVASMRIVLGNTVAVAVLQCVQGSEHTRQHMHLERNIASCIHPSPGLTRSPSPLLTCNRPHAQPPPALFKKADFVFAPQAQSTAPYQLTQMVTPPTLSYRVHMHTPHTTWVGAWVHGCVERLYAWVHGRMERLCTPHTT